MSHQHTTPRPAAWPQAPQPAARALRALVDALRRIGEGIDRRRRLARVQAEIDALDDATLRDIGLRRSEAASYWAESERLVDPTRLRLLQGLYAGR